MGNDIILINKNMIFSFLPNNFVSYIVPTIIIIIGLSFLLREFATWYWKINEIEKILGKIEKNTRNLNNTENKRVEINETKI